MELEHPNSIKDSGVDRVVGVDPKTERELLEYFKKKFVKEEAREYEQEFTLEMREVISELNEKLNEFVAEYGGKSLKMPDDVIHFLDPEKLPQDKFETLKSISGDKAGTWFDTLQKVFIYEQFSEGNKLRVCRTLVHEMLHIYQFSSSQKLKEDNMGQITLSKGSESIELGRRRSGIEITSPTKGQIFFSDLTEAITEEFATRFDQRYFKELPEIKEEYDKREWAINKYAKGKEISVEEVRKTLSHVVFEKQPDGITNYTSFAPSYRQEREKLYGLIDDICKTTGSDFEEVFKVFARAQLSGRLLPLARLIEKTYGKGSFRKLGEDELESKPS